MAKSKLFQLKFSVRILLKTKEDLIKKSNKARKDKNFKVLANVQKELGDLYFEIKQHNNALEAYKEQLQLCKNLGEQLNCAVAHRMIGEVYADEGNFQEALKHQALYLGSYSYFFSMKTNFTTLR